MSQSQHGQSAGGARALQGILEAVRWRTGQAFTQYKRTTTTRRVLRRAQLHRLDGLGAYVRFRETHPEEIDALSRELLIGVTSFFRDPDAWEALSQALRGLFDQRERRHLFHAWIPGCSTGADSHGERDEQETRCSD